MEVKSHVQMPKGLMKAFSHRTENGRCVYYLDLKDMEIKEEKINALGAIEGYFDKNSELILDRLYESPFFQATQNIRKFSQDKLESFSLTQEDEDAFLSFLKIALTRSKKTRESMESKSIIASVLPEVFSAQVVPTMHYVLSTTSVLNGLRLNFLINKSKLRLVAPRNCAVYSVKDGFGYYILPISPYVAVLYQPEQLYQRMLSKEGNPCYALVEQGEEEIIQSINLAAGKNEQFYNNEFLIGARRNELEILKSDLAGEQK